MTGKKLRTLLLSDGKPGHYHLAEGICAALQRRLDLDVTRLALARPWWLPARAASTLTNAGGAGAQLLPRAFGYEARPVAACDLVVSAGGDTLSANVALARAYHCPNIFYGSLRRYRADDFSLVLTSYAANAALPRHAMTLKPSAFDPDSLPARPAGAGQGCVTGLLIGGDSGTVSYRREDWDALLALVGGAANAGRRWIVSNSRRTPDTVGDEIARLAQRASGRIEFIDVRREGAGTLASLFAASDAIAVTVDSSSMISEAIWARKPVVALLPRVASLPALEQGYRDYLAREGWTGTLALAQASLGALDAQFDAIKPINGNPLDDLADLLAARVPSLFAL